MITRIPLLIICLLLFSNSVYSQGNRSAHRTSNSFPGSFSAEMLIPDSDLDWGYIPMEEGATGYITVDNPGETALRLLSVESSCGDVRIDYSSNPIPAGGSATIKLTWKPQRSGSIICFVTVKSDSRQMVNVVTIEGVAY